MDPLYLNTLYLYWEQVLSAEATMFVTVVQTGQSKHLFNLMTSPSCLEGEGEGYSAAT